MTETQAPVAVKWRPLGSYLRVRCLSPERETASGIHLPNEQAAFFDAEVLGAGPFRSFSVRGNEYFYDVEVGDRVLGPRAAFKYHEQVTQNGREELVWEGFCDVNRLIARIPGPEHVEILPLHSWLMIQQDRRSQIDAATGAQVQRFGSGILLAEGSTLGGTAREDREVEWHVRELDRLAKRWRKEEPNLYEFCERLRNFMNGVPKGLRQRVCRDAKKILAGDGVEWQGSEPVYIRTPKRSGVLLECGPSVLEDVRALVGQRVHWGTSAEAYFVSPGSGGWAFIRASDVLGAEA